MRSNERQMNAWKFRAPGLNASIIVPVIISSIIAIVPIIIAVVVPISRGTRSLIIVAIIVTGPAPELKDGDTPVAIVIS